MAIGITATLQYPTTSWPISRGKYSCTRQLFESLCHGQVHRREDNQIMGLELLAVALGLSSFSELVQGRHVVIHSDNAGAEWAIRKGESIMHRAGDMAIATCC